MHIIILCGGSGTRLADYSFPKPLNMINGKPSIAYCLQELPDTVTTLHFIAAPHLAKYNFEEIIRNQFKQKKCHIHWTPYFTRGPVETAWLGTSGFSETDDSVVFLDNDIVYNFPPGFFDKKNTAFLGYAKDTTTSEAFSFLTINDDNHVTNYKEKKRISDNFCCGVYGFKNIGQFREAASIIMNKKTESELYMSTLYQNFLESNIPVQGVHFPGDIYHIGSLKELQSSWGRLNKPTMRICFDLDNTLVTYPAVPGDYTTVKPVSRMIELARKMKSEGHTIIIHTARRMTTHAHVGTDIGTITFNTLAEFNIPYDEILFGKPIADMYIDDRAVNPFRDSVQSMGYLHTEEEKPLNMIPTNKFNTVLLTGDKITKTGPTNIIRGEIHFYENIPYDSALGAYFPRYFGSVKEDENTTLYIENIKGIPFYTLFKEQMITEHHIMQIFDCIDILHHTHGKGTIPSETNMIANYVLKLKERFMNADNYPFPDASEIQQKSLACLSDYKPSGAEFIHGDLWFSNILVDFNNNIKLIDMKGQVNGNLTTGGDIMYDYGKLYQSFLGYDAVLYGDTLSEVYRQKMTEIFLREAAKRGIIQKDIVNITQSLVIGTLPFIEEYEKKKRVWEFVKKLQ